MWITRRRIPLQIQINQTVNVNHFVLVTRCHIFRLKCTKFHFGWGSAPDPAGEAYSIPPDPLAGGKGASCPSPRTPPPLSALRALILGPSASIFGPSSLDTSSPVYYDSPPPDPEVLEQSLLYMYLQVEYRENDASQGQRYYSTLIGSHT